MANNETGFHKSRCHCMCSNVDEARIHYDVSPDIPDSVMQVELFHHPETHRALTDTKGLTTAVSSR